MKKLITLSLMILFALPGYSTIWTISNDGFTFAPATLTIAEGDTVFFDILSVHNAVEVSQTTWNANGTSPLAGGFSLPFGGGTVLPANLSSGTHFFVCQPHGGGGMKGRIIVTSTTGIEAEPLPAHISVFPNPSNSGKFQLKLDQIDYVSSLDIEVFDQMGHKVFSRQRMTLGMVHEVDLSALSNGLYLLKLYGDTKIYSTKIIIQ